MRRKADGSKEIASHLHSWLSQRGADLIPWYQSAQQAICISMLALVAQRQDSERIQMALIGPTV